MCSIPKTIHYCWFGKGEKNEKIKYCMNTWRKYLKGYNFKEWNEENFDINSNIYCKQAYENGKWAFVSDYVRLYALVNEGGIYLDTDVEITNNLDDFLKEKSFMGYHSDNSIPSALMGCEKGNSVFNMLLMYYNDKNFILQNGKMDETTNIDIITKLIVDKYEINLDNKLKKIDDLTIYPKEYFTQQDEKVKNYSIHHFNASWISKEMAMSQVYAYKHNYNLSLKWIESLLDNNQIFKYIKNKYNSIAIYGNGYLGHLLIKQAVNEKINISFIIEKVSTGNEYKGIEVISIDKLKDKTVDLIIVTPTYHLKTIKEELSKVTEAEIISLEKLL